MKLIKKHRNVFLRMMDIIIITAAYYVAVIIIENQVELSKEMQKNIIDTIILATLIYQIVLTSFRTYHNITRYENGSDYLVYILACSISCTIMIIFNLLKVIPIANERVNLIAELIIMPVIIGYRVFIRMILTSQYKDTEEDTEKKNVLVIGAGNATRILLETIKSSMKDTYKVIGLIDDNTNKVNYAISGNKILGTRYDIPRICRENNVEVIFFTISNISQEDRKKILEICQETGCKVRILPGTKELIKNKPLEQNFRDVQIEDLLGREPIKLNNKNIGELIKDKVILVTGGGGSIGSELCRQIIKFKPERLVIVDIYENNLYDIEQELKFNYPKIKIDAIVASVRETERLCEMIVQAKNKDSNTEYVAVRFGNVLGSNGSVVPLFKKQIANGGPVTVTHKEITRFFMTIPEAVSLVLQAMSTAKGGEIFVLDMGEPVKIYDMAVKLIKLSGLEPNVDIQIKITGLRPGEKLYEELLMSEEGLQSTKNDKIYIAEPMKIDMKMIEKKLAELRDLLENCNNEQKDEIKKVIKEVVPTFREPKGYNEEA